jgi:hypothetical protein
VNESFRGWLKNESNPPEAKQTSDSIPSTDGARGDASARNRLKTAEVANTYLPRVLGPKTLISDCLRGSQSDSSPDNLSFLNGSICWDLFSLAVSHCTIVVQMTMF